MTEIGRASCRNDRAAGASPRFELVDIHAALHSGETGEALRQKLRKALETCYTVFGPERTHEN